MWGNESHHVYREPAWESTLMHRALLPKHAKNTKAAHPAYTLSDMLLNNSGVKRWHCAVLSWPAYSTVHSRPSRAPRSMHVCRFKD